ncbi:MAG: hypothetical protein J5680_07020 [Neisseriaceae bacterium]|nr:hypothetical protein [Neisseriaceae bacterium]
MQCRYNAFRRCVKTYGFNWIATIFPTEKSRNDTVFCFFRQSDRAKYL